MTFARRMLHGTAAGAAGTTALNGVTYLDVALRARRASDTPQQAVETRAAKAGHPVPGEGEQRTNQLAGLGPLSGTVTGVLVAVGAGVARPEVVKYRLGDLIPHLAYGVVTYATLPTHQQ